MKALFWLIFNKQLHHDNSFLNRKMRQLMKEEIHAIRVVDYIAEFIVKLGVRNVFMLSGTGSIYLDDAMAFHEKITYTCARHEAAAVLMASAAAKLSGGLGVVISTTGPGATNAIGGVAEAWVDSVPIIVFSGQVPTDQIIPGVKSFGVQGFNIIENVKKITKYSHRVDDPTSIRYHLEKAVDEAVSGRPGPVWLDLPIDIQSALIMPNTLEKYKKKKPKIVASNSDIQAVLNRLTNSHSPLIVFGQGVRNGNAISELDEFLKATSIPSICSRMGVDIFEGSHPNFFGLGGSRGNSVSNNIFRKSDFIIAVGCSFTHAFGGEKYEYMDKTAFLVMVNLDNAEMSKPGLNVEIALNLDVKVFFTYLLATIHNGKTGLDFKDWLGQCVFFKKKAIEHLKPPMTNPINSYFLIKCLNNCSNENHIFTNDAGSANYVSSQALSLKRGQRELTSGAFYSMGVALPLAIGASVTEPDKQIIVITGDGSIELNIQELRTASKAQLNIKIFIINNGGYASIRKSQDEMAEGRYTDDQDVLNFRKVADAFELRYLLLDDCHSLEKLIISELNSSDPCLIEVLCDPNQEINNSFLEVEKL